MNRRCVRAARLATVVLSLAVVLFPIVAFARPGGGDLFGGGDPPSSGGTEPPSFGGGDPPGSGDGNFPGGGGGGGGGADFGLVIQLIALCIREPVLGGIVVIAVLSYTGLRYVSRSRFTDWTAQVSPADVPARKLTSLSSRALERIREMDPYFSAVLLEDFLYTLYAEVQSRRPTSGLAGLAAFVTPEAMQELQDPSLQAVSGIVIGAMRLNDLDIRADRVLLGADFQVNLSETRGGEEQRSYVVDRVLFTRAASARSRPPARTRKLDCPNCGAPLESMQGSVCGYCKQEVGGGRLDWAIASIRRVRTERLPELFSTETEERGTELPTWFDPDLPTRLAELRARDPSFDADAFRARVALVFRELGAGWSARDASRIRPYVSDNLFQYFGYFLGIYAERRARNVTDNARITRMDLANVLGDAWYDAITVRVFASSLDYTVSDDGQLLHGSRERERAYSEYWTLIRGRNTKGPARSDAACPQCGAPLRIGMAGNCEYCQARVVSGDFDWVLSRIEQDDVYAG